jgi:hypothetical protein
MSTFTARERRGLDARRSHRDFDVMPIIETGNRNEAHVQRGVSISDDDRTDVALSRRCFRARKEAVLVALSE